MSTFSFVSYLLLAVIGVSGKPPSAVAGGEIAEEGEFPYIAALTLNGVVFCGGSIIDSRHILTASHCLHDIPPKQVRQIVVRTGTNNVFPGLGNWYSVKNMTKHSGYEPGNGWKNDIAIVTLTKDIVFDERTKTVDLPVVSDTGDVWAVSGGWGDLSFPNGRIPSNLRKLSQRVIPKGMCNLPKNRPVFSTQLCAVNKRGSGLCSGDSGGPLVYDGKVIGVASFAYPCALGYPDVFTRVYEYVDWIRNTVKES